MSQAWGICPVCGKVIALDPVDVPGEPVDLLQHLQGHRSAPVHEANPPPVPTLDTFTPPHPARPNPTKPHARPARRVSP